MNAMEFDCREAPGDILTVSLDPDNRSSGLIYVLIQNAGQPDSDVLLTHEDALVLGVRLVKLAAKAASFKYKGKK